MNVKNIAIWIIFFSIILFFIPVWEIINWFSPCLQNPKSILPCYFEYNFYKYIISLSFFGIWLFTLAYLFVLHKVEIIFRKEIPLENKSAIRKMFLSAIENNKSWLIKTALSWKPLVYWLWEWFADEYMELRKRKQIFLKSLRFSTDNVDILKHNNYSYYNKEVRVDPFWIKITKSIIIWEENVAIIDTNNWTWRILKYENHTKEINEWFDTIWNLSK